MCILRVANIIWRSGHAIRSSFPLDFSSLHYSCRRVFTVFYVTAMSYSRFGRALFGVTFWGHFLAAKSYNAQKSGQGELAGR